MREDDHRALENAARALLRLPDLTIEILDALPVAVFAIDSTGRIRYVNVRGQLLTGYHKSVLYAMSSVDCLVPEDKRDRHALHRSGYLTDPHERPAGLSPCLELLHEDGTIINVSILLKPIPSPEGIIVMAVVTRVDE